MDEFEKYLEKHITDMVNYPEENGGRSMLKMALHEYRTFKARHKEDEPLAVLAVNKKAHLGPQWNGIDKYFSVRPEWFIEVIKDDGSWTEVCHADTYPAAETKARAYLNNLPDVKAEK